MAAVEIPVNEEAEMILAGIAVAFPADARALAERTSSADFYDPRHWRIIERGANPALERIRIGRYQTPTEARASEISRMADVDERYVLHLGENWSSLGCIEHAVAAVKEARRRREAMSVARELYNGAAVLPPNELDELAQRLADLAVTA